MSRAVCLKCGADKTAHDQICAACGHRPEGEGLLVAWLLSDAHLASDALDAVAARIRGGEAIRPSDALLDTARRALGTHPDDDAGLSLAHALGLLATSVLLTPLVGITLAVWWWSTRPRSAWQALGLSVPVGLLYGAAVVWAVVG